MHRPRYHQPWVDFRESDHFIPDILDLQGRNPKNIGPIVQNRHGGALNPEFGRHEFVRGWSGGKQHSGATAGNMINYGVGPIPGVRMRARLAVLS